MSGKALIHIESDQGLGEAGASVTVDPDRLRILGKPEAMDD